MTRKILSLIRNSGSCICRIGLTEGFTFQLQSVLILALWKDFVQKSMLDYLKEFSMAMQNVFKPRISNVAVSSFGEAGTQLSYRFLRKNPLQNKNETQNIFSHGSLSIGLKVICGHGSDSKVFLNWVVHAHETDVGTLKEVKPIICVCKT